MRITSIQKTVIYTKAPSPTTMPFDSSLVGYSKSTKFIPNTSTVVALLLQYSGSRIFHMDEFSSCKQLTMRLNW